MIRHTLALALIALVCLTGSTIARDTAGSGEADLLQPRRWTEIGYGLSLRPPMGAQVLPPTTDGALITFMESGLYEMDVRILQTSEASSPEELKKVSEEQLGAAFQTAMVVREEKMKVAGRPSFAQYLKVVNRERGNWMLAQVFVQIDPVTFAVLRLDVEEKDLPRVLPLFHAVVEDAAIMSVQDLDRMRSAWFEAGEALLDATPPERWGKALPEQVWWRIQNGRGEGSVHVGWAMWRLGRSEALGEKGLSFSQTMQLRNQGAQWDTMSHAFENDKGTYEMWEVKVTRRAEKGNDAGAGPGAGAGRGVGAGGPQTWAETGVRTQGVVAVAQESPERQGSVKRRPGDPSVAAAGDHHRWPVPPGPYVSQARASLLPFIVPGDREEDYAFYAYDPGTADLVMRTLRVRPAEGGGYAVYIRPSPRRAEQVLMFDNHRPARPLYHDLPDGRRWVPTTTQQLQQLEAAKRE